MKEGKKFKKGFTLIELLVVIAIIGILAGIVLVSMSSARNRAYRASAMATVSGIGSELIICQNDQLIVAGQSSTSTGGGTICTNADYTDNPAHQIEWPSLSDTGGYCYSSASSSCVTIPRASELPTTFYLYNANNNLITCTWSTTENLTCTPI